MEEKKTTAPNPGFSEEKFLVLYGYTHRQLSKVLEHFSDALPDYVSLTHETKGMVTLITLSGHHESIETLRFKLNQLRRNLQDLFSEELLGTERLSVAQILGRQLSERELTVACAESCTGGNIAHRIVQVPGSSAYFLGSVVSYSNDIKADVLGVERSVLMQHGAVSRETVTQMAEGVSRLMRTDCAIATSGIAGPDGGTRFKPVGTVWIAVKYLDTLVSECVRFDGDRNEVIEAATNHAMVMLIKLLRNSYIEQEDLSDE